MMRLTPDTVEKAIQEFKKNPELVKEFLAKTVFKTDVNTFDQKIEQIRRLVNEKSNITLLEGTDPLTVLQASGIVGAVYLYGRVHQTTQEKPMEEGKQIKVDLEVTLPDIVVVGHYIALALELWLTYLIARLVNDIEKLIREREQGQDQTVTPGQIHDRILLIAFIDLLINNLITTALLLAGAVYVALQDAPEYDLHKYLILVAGVLRFLLWLVQAYYKSKLDFILEQTQWQLYVSETVKRGITSLDSIKDMLNRISGTVEVPETVKQLLQKAV